MSTGIATLAQIDLVWLLRALRSAGFVDSAIDEEDDDIRLMTEFGELRIGIIERSAVLRFASVIGTSDQLPTDLVARAVTLRRIRVEMAYARLAHYPGTETLMLEYECPLLSGMSRPQFLAIVRSFLSDLSVVQREGISGIQE